MSVRLTHLAKRAGCAAKQPPGFLLPLLRGLPEVRDPRVVVGSATSDDAAIYRLRDDVGLVLTTDFFTPIVDDPYAFGAIAAANALSDVYAMGGRPLAALNLVGFPDDLLPPSVLAEILRGGADKARAAGIDIVGGHTIKTDEPIYGLSVTGVVDPAAATRLDRGRAGDLLVLTKPLGTGIITTAAKQDADEEQALDAAIAVMSALNDGACSAMLEVGAAAATDVTGFGLLGHLRNLAAASRVGATVWLDELPVLEAARTYVARNLVPGGTHANHRFLAEHVDFAAELTREERLLACDAQTSGGLLIAIAEAKVPPLLAALRRHQTLAAAVVGRLTASAPGRIGVTRRRLASG